MKVYLLTSGYLLALLVFNACKINGPVDKPALLAYINDPEHGVIQNRDAADVVYTLKYRPKDLLIAQDLQSNASYNVDSLRTNYNDCLYFILSISQDSSEVFNQPRENYTTLLNNLAFRLNEQITLVTDQATQPFYLKDFIYPRLYGTTPTTSVLLCFRDASFKKAGHFTITIKDFVNESEEELKFNFFKKDIDRVPTLKL